MKDAIVTRGVVVDHFRGDRYAVEARIGNASVRVLCRRAGRLVVHRVLVIPGDEVEIEVNPYDTTRGRIVYRGRRAAA